MPKFSTLWTGQLLSALGSTTMAFGLNVWIFKTSGSMAYLSIGMLLASLPIIFLSPLSGIIADRYNRRHIILIADVIGITVAGTLAILSHTGNITIATVYSCVFLQACAGTLRWPAYQALIGEVVSQEKRRHAAGMLQISDAASQIAAPAIGGALFAAAGTMGVIVCDFVGYMLAIGTSLLIRETIKGRASERRESLLASLDFAWTTLKRDAIVTNLLAFNASINAVIGLITILATPIILSFANSRALGMVTSTSLSGMLIGGVASIYIGKTENQTKLICAFSVAASLAIVAAPIVANPFWFAGCGFIFFFSVAVINSAIQLIWQNRLPTDIQGRIFSIKRAIVFLVLPISYIIAPTLSTICEDLARRHLPISFLDIANRYSPNQTGAGLLLCLSGFCLLGITPLCLMRRKLWVHRLPTIRP
ncbi:MFS transporter [Burkholderia ubonensis]|uniref:MFS transporter n=1 Tax=Burkholderia ubonensis TaxID=101571 RepID=UPI0009B5593F|nr:MFS transporter [Burkholderia ubonensis]